MTNESPLAAVSDAVGARVRQVREQRRWTVEQVAEACFRAGAAHLTVASLYALESGRREKATGRRRRLITVDELLVLAYVLAVHPVDLVVPPEVDDDAPFAVTPGTTSTAGAVRQWVGGLGFIREPATVQELAEALRTMPKGRAEALSRAWFTRERQLELTRAVNAARPPDTRSLADLIAGAAAVSDDPEAVAAQMLEALRDLTDKPDEGGDKDG